MLIFVFVAEKRYSQTVTTRSPTSYIGELLTAAGRCKKCSKLVFFLLTMFSKCQKERPAITRLIPAEKWHRMMANLSRKALGKKRSRNMIRPRREKQIVLVRRAINPWIEWNTDLQLSKCIIRTQKQNIKPVNRLVYHRQAQGTVRGADTKSTTWP